MVHPVFYVFKQNLILFVKLLLKVFRYWSFNQFLFKYNICRLDMKDNNQLNIQIKIKQDENNDYLPVEFDPYTLDFN
jgi:hypothetical protein